MSAAAFTPGPWYRTNLTIHTESTPAQGALRIARVYEAGIETDAAESVEQATANARLIAAAPELSGAAHYAVSLLESLANEDIPRSSKQLAQSALAELARAIARAEGKE